VKSNAKKMTINFKLIRIFVETQLKLD